MLASCWRGWGCSLSFFQSSDCGWCWKNPTLLPAAVPTARQKGRGLLAPAPREGVPSVGSRKRHSKSLLGSLAIPRILCPKTPGERLANALPLAWQQEDSTPISHGLPTGWFFLLKRSECQGECIHAQHGANYLCSRKWGWHRSLGSPWDPIVSVPMAPLAPSICRGKTGCYISWIQLSCFYFWAFPKRKACIMWECSGDRTRSWNTPRLAWTLGPEWVKGQTAPRGLDQTSGVRDLRRYWPYGTVVPLKPNSVLKLYYPQPYSHLSVTLPYRSSNLNLTLTSTWSWSPLDHNHPHHTQTHSDPNHTLVTLSAMTSPPAWPQLEHGPKSA